MTNEEILRVGNPTRKYKFFDEQILKRAIKKAIKNKYNADFHPSAKDTLFYIENGVDINIKDYYFIIFSINFAKAFFGEKWTKCDCGGEEDCKFEPQPKWKFHLQQMVLEENKIKYLKKFL